MSKAKPQVVELGGKKFSSRDELVLYFRGILRGNKKNYRLSADEQAVAADLLKYHPKYEEKIGPGVQFIIVGANPKFPDTPSFMVVQKNTQQTVDYSYLKIADVLYPEEGKERAKRKSPMSGVLARVMPVPDTPQCLKDLKAAIEGTGKSKRHLAREPVFANRGESIVQFCDPADLDSFIAAKPLVFENRELKVEKLKQTEEVKYWSARVFEKEQKMQEKAAKAARRGGRGGGRGGFRGGRGRGGGFGGGFDRDSGGGYSGSKHYGDDRGDNGPNKRPRY